MDTVLKRALAKNPEDRYPTCSDFAFATENACRSSKNWRPVAPGALQSMPTMAARAHPVAPRRARVYESEAVVAAPMVASGVSADEDIGDEVERRREPSNGPEMPR